MAAEWVWIVDDDRSIRWVLAKALQQAGMQVAEFPQAHAMLAALAERQPDLIVTDIRMPGMNGLALLENLTRDYPEIPVIVITAFSDLDSAVAAYQGGAFEYLPKPFDVDEAVELVQRAARQRHPQDSADTSEVASGHLIGQAASMQEVFRAIGRLSRANLTVLITGESGTGKELVARALHEHSPRAAKPFIAINTAAIPRELLESELFGHERGAFTGATQQRRGRFEQADGGTLFLDEIGDMPADLQTRLLRVLSDGSFFRVGGHSPVHVDTRIIAATHQALEERARQGQFREDLFHRLNVIRIQLPPLRKRREDIPLLARHFLQKIAEELQVPTKKLASATEQRLRQLDWPGNVRQLENTCRWLTVMASSQWIMPGDLPAELDNAGLRAIEETASAGWEPALRQWAMAELREGHDNLLAQALPRFERELITCALRHTLGKRQEAARLLGWGRNTLTRKMKELGMEEESG